MADNPQTDHAGAASSLRPATHRILLEKLAVDADIGFHDFEIGHPQRLLITVDVGIDLAHWPAEDTQEASWDYDRLRSAIIALATARHYNLQETLAQEIWQMVTALPGVISLNLLLQKPDIYPDAETVGVFLGSG